MRNHRQAKESQMNLTNRENQINNLQNKLTPSGKRAFARAFQVNFQLSCADCRKIEDLLAEAPEFLQELLSWGEAFKIPQDIKIIEEMHLLYK
jgi:hypothetical protein